MKLHPEACWRIHITCPVCGTPVVSVASAADRHRAVDTRAVVECQPCAEQYLIEVTMTSTRAAWAAERSITATIAREARRVSVAG